MRTSSGVGVEGNNSDDDCHDGDSYYCSDNLSFSIHLLNLQN